MSPEAFEEVLVIGGIKRWDGVGDSKGDTKDEEGREKEYSWLNEYVKGITFCVDRSNQNWCAFYRGE